MLNKESKQKWKLYGLDLLCSAVPSLSEKGMRVEADVEDIKFIKDI